MIETSSDFRQAVELCQLVVEAAVAEQHAAVGATLGQLRTVLEHEPTRQTTDLLRSLLEQFHAERLPPRANGDPGPIVMVARVDPTEFTRVMNKLAALERRLGL